MAKADNRPILKFIGENIRNLRLSMKYSQKDFADSLDITQAAISHFEAGDRDPGIDFLFRIADKFGVPVTTLIPVGRSGMDDDAMTLVSGLVAKNPAWIDAFDKARRLTDHQTDLVISMIECLSKGNNING